MVPAKKMQANPSGVRVAPMRVSAVLASASWMMGIVCAAAGVAHADDEASTPARSDKGTIGVGLQLGEPTGITAKIYLKDDQAIQACAGSAFVAGGLEADADYVFHPWILQKRDSFVMPLYLGPGLRAIDYR